MLSNTCDARRIGRLLGYTMPILVIIMVRESICNSLKKSADTQLRSSASSISGYTRYYKEVIRLELFIFLESLKDYRKSKSFGKV